MDTWTYDSKCVSYQLIYRGKLNKKKPEKNTFNNFIIRKNGYGSEILPPTKCSLSCAGEVTCVPTIDLNIKCDTDRSQWPDDKHKCTIEFGSSYQTDKEIIFSSEIFIPNHRKLVQTNWKIDGPVAKFINKTSKFNKNDKFSVFTMTYNVMRINNQIKSLFLYPTIGNWYFINLNLQTIN